MLQICNMMNAPADEYFTFQVIPVMLVTINTVEKYADAFHQLVIQLITQIISPLFVMLRS